MKRYHRRDQRRYQEFSDSSVLFAFLFACRPNASFRSGALLFVAALHLLALLFVLNNPPLLRLTPCEQPLFVHLIEPAAQPKPQTPTPPPPKKIEPQPEIKPLPVAETAKTAKTAVKPMAEVAPVAAPPTPAPMAPAPAPTVLPPMHLEELAVVCPGRGAPEYPQASRRRGEQGHLLVRVRLDAAGTISDARVVKSSGFPRLDEAAVTAIRGWRCNPARRNGVAIEATAMQPFDFTLEGE